MSTETITTTVETLLGVATTVINFVATNTLLSLCLVAGTIVPIGFKIFRSAKRTTR